MNFDDQPVGQHKALNISEQPPEGQPAESAPAAEKTGTLAERALNKNSKTRLEAMSELLKLFTDAKAQDPVFAEYYPNFPKYLADSHPGAQEKALEAFLVLLSKNPPPLDSTLAESINSIVEKGMTSSKSQTKTKSLECVAFIAELKDAQTPVKETLTQLMGSKTQKVVAATLQTLTHLLSAFGDSVFPAKDFVAAVASQAGSTNAQVRTEALGYLKEAHKWNKGVVVGVVGKLRQAQQDELNKQFAEQTEPPVPTRSVKGAKKESPKKKKEVKKDDPYASAVEVSVLKRFGEAWCDQVLAAKKWNEKRDKLEELLKAVSVDKLKNDNFNELGQALKKLLNDSNIVVVNLALKIIGQLAKGLRGYFSVYAKHIFEPTVQKCKDRKTVGEAQKCLENLVFSLKMEDMLDIIKETLGDKSPQVKIRVCAWLETAVLPHTAPDLAQSMASCFVPTLAKLTDDAAGEVRDSALSCLGIIKALVSDPNLEKTIGEMNSQKQEKIAKAAEQIQAARGTETKAPAAEKAEDVKSVVAEEEKVVPKEEEPEKTEEPKEEVKGEEETKPEEPQVVAEEVKKVHAKPKPVLKSSKKTAEAKSKAGGKASAGAGAGAPKEIPEEDVGPIMSDEDADKLIADSVPSDIVGKFDLPEWKERQKGLQELHEWINKNSEKTQQIMEGMTVWLKKKLKDFKESNQGVMKEALQVLSTLASKFVTNKKFAHETVQPLIERMNDLKQAEICTSLLLSISDSATPTYVSTLAVKCAYTSKSINVIKGTLSLLIKMLDGYTANLLPVKLTLDYAKHCLAHANQQIRNTATEYISQVHASVGDIIRPWLAADLKESALKNLESELAKPRPKPSSEVKRELRGESAEDAAKKKKKDLADSLVPRVNIASQLTTKLISSLSDSSMKHRQEAKDTIEKILFSANNRIAPTGLNQLINALKGRMGEPCKNLAKAFIVLVGNLALAVGPGFKQYSKLIVQPLMYNLADKQAAIRTETVAAMDKIADAAGAELIINNMGPLLEKDNPEMRNELLSWVLKNKEAIAKADGSTLVVPLVTAMQDRSKEIRALTEQVMAEVMPQVGYTAFGNAIQDLKPVVKSSLQSVLEKYKAPVPKSGEDNGADGGVKAAAAEDAKMEDDKSDNPPPEEKPDTMDEAKANTAENQAPLQTEEQPKPSSPSIHKPPLDKQIAADKSASKPKHAEEEEKKHQNSAAEMSMSSSRSTNDLRNKPESRKKSMAETKKSAGSKTKLFKGASRSPSKSQVSGSSATGGLLVETVVLTTIGNKERRAEQDKNTKWPVNEIREDYVEKLKKSLHSALHPNLYDSMFASQFKKNLAAVVALTEGLKNEFASMTDLLDLFCKWVVIKMVDQSNTAMTKSLLEFLSTFFKKLAETGYQMMDFEAAAILPMLCERTGINNPNYRQQIKELLRTCCQIYSVPKVTTHLMNALESKNQKTKVECLDLLKEIARKHGAKVLAPRDTKIFVKLLASNDNTVKTEATEILIEVYKFRGESIWGSTGDVPEKTKEMLKKKFASLPKPERPATSIDSLPPEKRPLTPSIDLSSTSKEPSAPAIFEEAKIKSPLFHDSSPFAKDSTPDDTSSMNEMKFSATGKISSQEKFVEGAKRPQTSARKETVVAGDFCHTGRQDGEAAKYETLEQCMETLRTGDISKRVDALMALNEKATSLLEREKESLILHCNELFDTFTDVLREVFDKPPHDIPIRFVKYFMTVVNKICSNKQALRGVSDKSMRGFSEQLLTKLLYEGLEKMGENNEGEYMIKALNSTMLRILEGCNSTRTFIMLIELFQTYKSAPAVTGKIKTGKLPSLIVRCILKLTKVMESLAPTLEVGKLLLCLHEYLMANPSNAVPKSANDDIGIRIVKTIINELVKARGESIWEDYRAVEAHEKPDVNIKRWISIILKSVHPAGYHAASSTLSSTDENTPIQGKESSDELKEIFKGLNSQATFHDAIKSLNEYMVRHPQLELSQYFVSCSKGFREYVLSSLQKYNTQSKSSTVSTGELMSSRDLGITSPREKTVTTPTPSGSSAEYRAKMALLRQKFGMGPTKDEKTTPSASTQRGVHDNASVYQTQQPASSSSLVTQKTSDVHEAQQHSDAMKQSESKQH